MLAQNCLVKTVSQGYVGLVEGTCSLGLLIPK